MLKQQLTTKVEDMSGKLVIVGDPGTLVELQGLAQELALRPTMETEGDINILPPVEEPPPPGPIIS